MASTYTNDLRLELIATGEAAATWGDKTNVNLTNIAAAFGYATQDGFAANADSTTTVADGAADPARAMYFKVTSSATLTATRTLTIAPNTISRVMWIENATTGGQSIQISQGTGANVTIATGKTAVVYLDGAGSGAAVVDAMAGVSSGASDTLAEILASGNATGGTDIAVGTGDDITFADSSKAIFGAGSDLSIYSDGSTGKIDGNVDVTGTGSFSSSAPYIDLFETDTTDLNSRIVSNSSSLRLQTVNDDGTGATNRLLIDHTTGDINLGYEDTGTTAKLFWDASAERLGIGNSATDVSGTGLDDLVVGDGSAGGGIVIDSGASVDGAYAFASAGAKRGRVRYDNSTDSMHFETNNTGDKLTISSAGSVGIGTTSPAQALVVKRSSGDTYLDIARDTQAQGQVALQLSTGTGGTNWIMYQDASSNDLRFYGNSSNRMVLDSGGKLLVGKTASDYAVEGVEIRSNEVLITKSTTNPLNVRNGQNGGLIAFTSGSSSVGSIGVASGDNFYIGATAANHTGLQFADNVIVPMVALSNSDATTDLGASTVRFKDLYLSGAINLGGDVLPTTDAGFVGHSDLGDPSLRYEDAYVRDGVTTGSDGRDKQDIEELSDAEQRVAVACKGLLRKWRWKSSVAEKGDEARTHFGIIAQDLQAAFEAEGLDAGDYAMFIHSTWTDEETGEERSRMGVRYSELLAFIIAAI